MDPLKISIKLSSTIHSYLKRNFNRETVLKLKLLSAIRILTRIVSAHDYWILAFYLSIDIAALHFLLKAKLYSLFRVIKKKKYFDPIEIDNGEKQRICLLLNIGNLYEIEYP